MRDNLCTLFISNKNETLELVLRRTTKIKIILKLARIVFDLSFLIRLERSEVRFFTFYLRVQNSNGYISV